MPVAPSFVACPSLSPPLLCSCASFSSCDTLKSQRDESYGNRSCASNPSCRVLKTYHEASHCLFTSLFVFSFILNSRERLQKLSQKARNFGQQVPPGVRALGSRWKWSSCWEAWNQPGSTVRGMGSRSVWQLLGVCLCCTLAGSLLPLRCRG